MPEFKVRTPEGRYFNVTVPPGTTKEQALAYAQGHMPAPGGALDPAPVVNAPGTEPGGIWDRIQALSRRGSPKGFYGPGMLAQGSVALQKVFGMTPETPQQNYDRMAPQLETINNILGSLVAPQRNLGMRMLSGIGVPATIKAIGGHGPGEIFEGGMTGAGAQAAAEILSGIIKVPRLNSLANTARAEFEKKLAAQGAILARDADRVKTLQGFEGNRHQQLTDMLTQEHDLATKKIAAEYGQKLSSHEELLAGTIMDDAKKSVPSWKDLPSSVAGLYTAVLGKGKELLSDAFQTALDAAKATARGKTVEIPAADAGALNVAVIKGAFPQKSSTVRDATGADDLRLLVPVDAAELIDALPGLKNKALKVRSHDALAQADLGVDPKAMREYTVGKGTIQMADENKIFKFDETTNTDRVDPVALAQGLNSRKRMDTIQNREMGDINTNPGLQVAKTRPLPPKTPPLELPPPPAQRGPLVPETIPNPDETGAITTWHVPGTQYARAKIGGALGGLGGLAAGAAIPKGFTIKAPMSPLEAQVQQRAPALLGALLRTVGDTSQAEAGPQTTSPEGILEILKRIKDLEGAPERSPLSPEQVATMDAEIQAAKQEGRTALTDPRLSLTLDKLPEPNPVENR